jgi:cytochrome c oxidase assembly factor CtaG
MKTLALFGAYVASAALIFVVPAIIIALIFPCSYDDVVTCPIYAAFMGIISLVAAIPVCEELDNKY